MTPTEVPWPNQQEPVDGVTPVAETSQDPNFFGDYVAPEKES
jgi:hypothetical protein